MMNAPAVFICGMFDMDNYGDLLFPVVAAHRLAAYGYGAVPVAPSARSVGLCDTLPPTDIAQMLSGEGAVAGILVGGGYLIHTSAMDFLPQYRIEGSEAWCGPGLWLGAILAAALRNVPVAWNAPGVPHPFSARQHRLIEAALRACSYLAVRDRGSARLLAPPADVAVHVVPDPVTELPRIWPKESLSHAYRELLQRKRLPGDVRLLAIHIRNRSIAGLSAASLGEMLADFARAHRLTPMLVAVGASHDDPAVARLVAPHVGPSCVVLDDPLSLREITAALAHGAVYIGASLHGYIVSAAYGVPGVLVARPAYHKFSGFLEHTGRPQDLARDWPEALKVAARDWNEAPVSRIPAAVFTALDDHWRGIRAALQTPDRHADARREFALDLLRHGIRTVGPGWAMQPIPNRLMRSAGAPKRDVRHNRAEGMRYEQSIAD